MTKKAASLSGALFAAKGSATPAMDERLLVDAREVRSPKMLESAPPRPIATVQPRKTDIVEFPVLEATSVEPVLTLDESVVYAPVDRHAGRRSLRLACSIGAAAVLSVGLWVASYALGGSTDKDAAPVESRGGASLSLQAQAAVTPAGLQLAGPIAGGMAGGIADTAAAATPVAKIDLPPMPARKPLLPAQSGGDYVIQLSSVGSAAAAEQEWRRFQESFPDLLSDLGFNAQRTALRNRGTVYGVQTGPFADLGSAREMCALLRAKNQDCLVIKR